MSRRMHKKKHINERMAACSDFFIDDAAQIPECITTHESHLEIGCGKGQFICEMARNHKNIVFFAIEREPNVILISAERARNMALSNVKFIKTDIREALEFPLIHKFSRIYINFCDPWPKTRHAGRRLTHLGYLSRYKNLLCENGEIWFKTDSKPLFEFSVKNFQAAGYTPFFMTEDLHNSDSYENVMTEYETLFSNMGQPIYSIKAR